MPRQAATVIVAARRRRAARGADGAAHAQGPLHGRRVGVPGRRGRRHEGEGDAAHRAAAVREVAEEVGIDAARSGRARALRALDHAARGHDPLRHLFLPRRRARGAEASLDGQEIVDARWFEPARALEGSEAGELLMVFPTIKNLERLAGFDTADALLEWAATHEVRPSSPGSRARARRRGSCSMRRMSRLTVAVTGPTGEIGRAFLRALDADPDVGPRARHGAAAVRSRRARATRPSTARATCSTAMPSTR